MSWEIESFAKGDPELDEHLAEGWEPFSVTQERDYWWDGHSQQTSVTTTIWIRRRVSKEEAP